MVDCNTYQFNISVKTSMWKHDLRRDERNVAATSIAIDESIKNMIELLCSNTKQYWPTHNERWFFIAILICVGFFYPNFRADFILNFCTSRLQLSLCWFEYFSGQPKLSKRNRPRISWADCDRNAARTGYTTNILNRTKYSENWLSL